MSEAMIKKKKTALIILLVVGVIVGIMALTGCEAVTTEETSQTEEKTSFILNSDDEIRIWTDEETGVQYLIFKGYHKGGITPRLNADGTPYTINQDENTENHD